MGMTPEDERWVATHVRKRVRLMAKQCTYRLLDARGETRTLAREDQKLFTAALRALDRLVSGLREGTAGAGDEDEG